MTTDVTGLIAQSRSDATALIVTGNAFLARIEELANFDAQVIPEVSFADVVAIGGGAAAAAEEAINRVLATAVPRPIFPAIREPVPVAPTFDTVPAIAVQVVPDFTSVAPVLDIPVIPDVALPAAPGVGPTFRDPIIPTTPVITLPTAPTLANIVIPDPPSITVATFDKTLEVVNLLAPSATFTWAEEAYSSSLLDEVQAKLLGDLEDGSYGIDVNDEVRLYERARSRVNLAADAEEYGITNTHASRGWSKPTGALAADLTRGRQAALEKSAEINADIMVKRADLFNSTRRFAIEQSIALETITMSYHGAVQERALNAAKATIEMAIALFDSQVKQHNFYIEQYKAEVAAYSERIKAGLVQASIYKTQIEAVDAQVGVQRGQIEIYKANLSGVESVINIYRTQMEAANISAQVERTRFEAFKSTIDAYVAQVQAEVAKFNVYESKVKAETAKVNAYESEARAYGIRVDAVKTKAAIDVERLRAIIAKNDSKVSAYNADISRFRASIELDVSVLNALQRQYEIDVSIFTTRLNAMLKTFDIRTEGTRLYFDSVKTDMTDKIERARLAYEQLINSAKVRMESAEFGTTFIGSQITGTLNSINTLAASVQST